jgi:hypothetical protein
LAHLTNRTPLFKKKKRFFTLSLLHTHIHTEEYGTFVRDGIYVAVGFLWVLSSDLGTIYLGPIIDRIQSPGSHARRANAVTLTLATNSTPFDPDNDLSHFSLRHKLANLGRLLYAEFGAIVFWTGT